MLLLAILLPRLAARKISSVFALASDFAPEREVGAGAEEEEEKEEEDEATSLAFGSAVVPPFSTGFMVSGVFTADWSAAATSELLVGSADAEAALRETLTSSRALGVCCSFG